MKPTHFQIEFTNERIIPSPEILRQRLDGIGRSMRSTTADKVVDLIYLKYLKAKITFEHDRGVETYPFAREAVREAVYNAIIPDHTIRVLRMYFSCRYIEHWGRAPSHDN